MTDGHSSTPGFSTTLTDVTDGRALGQDLAVVELQHRNMALGVDPAEVAAIGGGSGRRIDLHGVEGLSNLAQHNVRGQRTGAGLEVESHGSGPC